MATETVVKRRISRCGLLHHSLATLATLIGITIIIIVAVHLDSEIIYNDTTYSCVLGAGAQSTCNYAYAVVAISILLTIVIHLIQMTNSRIFNCGFEHRWADTMLSLLLCIWWSVGSGVISVGLGKAEGMNLPQNNWRVATLVLFWTEFLIFLLIAISGASRNAMRGMVSETATVKA